MGSRKEQGREKEDSFNLSYSQIEHLIDEWILNERNRKIIKRSKTS